MSRRQSNLASQNRLAVQERLEQVVNVLRVETRCFRASVENGRQRKVATGVCAIEAAHSTIVEVPLLVVDSELNKQPK